MQEINCNKCENLIDNTSGCKIYGSDPVEGVKACCNDNFRNYNPPKLDRILIPGGTYRHFKGGEYVVKCIAAHTETMELYVLYENVDTGRLWVRPCLDFMSPVDREKYPDATQVYRFELIEEE